MTLRDERCEACTASTPRLDAAELGRLREELHGDWEVVGAGERLHRVVRFGDFAAALAAAVHVGAVAEQQGHHPDLGVSWGRLVVDIHTHAVGGLTRADTILAAHVDAALGAGPGA